MTWLWINLALFLLDGFYQGLRGRFGPNILDGIRRYRSGLEPDFIGSEVSINDSSSLPSRTRLRIRGPGSRSSVDNLPRPNVDDLY